MNSNRDPRTDWNPRNEPSGTKTIRGLTEPLWAEGLKPWIWNCEIPTDRFRIQMVPGCLIFNLLWVFCNKSWNVQNVMIFVRFFEWAYDIFYHFDFFGIRWFFLQIIFPDLWHQIFCFFVFVRFCPVASIFSKTVCRTVPVDQISSPSHQITIISNRADRMSCRDHRNNEQWKNNHFIKIEQKLKIHRSLWFLY